MLKAPQSFIFLLPALLLLTPALAAAPTWNILPQDSSLTFTAIQNDAPVSGEFKKFSADISFDPLQAAGNKVKITIDMNSLTDPYGEISDTLKGKDWFDTTKYPTAVYQCSNFIKTGDKTWEAKGMLTIRDKTLPVTLSFTQEQYTGNAARIKGSTTIQRTAFGVGQGEWSDTSAVKDDVKINFVVSAVKK